MAMSWFRRLVLLVTSALAALAAYFLASIFSVEQESAMASSKPEQADNVYKFKVRNLDGEDVDMEKYK